MADFGSYYLEAAWLYGQPGSNSNGGPLGCIARLRVQLPDGSWHELRKDDVPRDWQTNQSFFWTGSYYAVDGSQLRFDATGAWLSSGTLWLPDGSRYIFAGENRPRQHIDRNGNTLNYDPGTKVWTDTMGRTFGSVLPDPNSPLAKGDTTYTVPGLNGAPLTYTFRWRYLVDPVTGETILTNPDPDPNNRLAYDGSHICSTFPNPPAASPRLFNSTGTKPICTTGRFNAVVLAEIVLPNGQSYRFNYNQYGEIDKVTYPTGGYERFVYSKIAFPMTYYHKPFDEENRGVFQHFVSKDGTAGSEVVWQHGIEYTPGTEGPYVTTATAPDGTVTKHYVFAHPLPYNGDPNLSVPFGMDDVRSGMIYEDRTYSATGQMLRRTLTEWTVNGPTPGGYSGATSYPRITKRVDIVLDTGTNNALATTTTMQYDADLNVIAVNRYDYVSVDSTTAQYGAIAAIPTGSTPVRTEETTYLVNDPSISASTRDAYRARNLLALPTSTRVKDSNSNIVAQGAISYDEAAYPLLTYGSVTGWTDPGTNVRGSVTTTGRWLNTTNSWLQIHGQYDQFGNVRYTWDAKGNQSQIEYSSSYSYAYPTLTRTAVPDPNGQTGSNTALVSTSVFDFSTGLVTSTTDANNATFTPEYNDPLNRLTRAVGASGSSAQSQSQVSYDDGNRIVTGRSDLNAFNDNGMKTESLYDSLGRAIESRQYEGGTNYIAVQTQYDALGRAFKVSNPFRPWKNETPVWTTSAFDALGRVISVTTPDGAVVSTAYSGDRVLVTDQSGKQRMSRTNALGQLTDIWEVTAPESGVTESISFPGHAEVTAGYRTSYSYDTLGNLIKVTQGSQQRFFAYDSLSRLLRVRNPEQSVNTNLPAYTDPITGNSQWSMAYSYDNNGNLVTRIDARNITTTLTYDALNRNTSITYTNDPANTPTVTHTYDGATNGKGRLWSTQTGGNSGSTTTVDSYDALGRPLKLRQDFYYQAGGYTAMKSYIVQRTYDRAGHVKTQTYPSGHSVTYNYDDAGRLSDRNGQAAFSGNLGDGVTRTYANDFQYTSWNSIEQEKFGTDTPLYHKQRFNQRGQLWDMRLSTLSYNTYPADGDRGSIVNYYSNNFVQGGSGVDNNGNLLRQETYIPGSSFFQDNFTYDSLNRLKSISEKLNGTGADTFKQAYTYDRWGNRTIDQTNTTTNVPHPAYTVDPSNNNRLIAPTGYTHLYDADGNQTRDTYTNNNSIGNRVFDAENRMTGEQFPYGKGSTWAYYTYNGDGQRVRRNTAGYETWQVYGFDGELLAEYPQTGPSVAVAQPQKEYGYRNGQLLVTAEAYANRAWNMPATQTDNYSATTTADKAVNGDVDGGLSNGSTSMTNSHPNSWWQVDLQSVKPIDSITVWGRTDCCPEMTSDFYVFVSDNPFSSYDLSTTIAQAGVSNYHYVDYMNPRSVPVNRTGRYVRVQLAGTNSLALSEVQVWGQAAKLEWLVTDHLGTPRIIADKTGSTAGVSRHDYLPFGEELFAGTGGRTSTQGYTANDGVRQRFTQQERDDETGLDYMHARYYASTQGRFTSPDTLLGTISSPQSLNRYAYVINNPMNFSDPTGHVPSTPGAGPASVLLITRPDYDPESILPEDMRGSLNNWDQRVQNEVDAMAATDAYNHGRSSEGDAIMDRNNTLVAVSPGQVTVSAEITGVAGPQESVSNKPGAVDIVFTTAVIRDNIRDEEAVITVVDFTPNFTGRTYRATFQFEGGSRVCMGKPFSLSLKLKTGTDVKLRGGRDIGNKVDSGPDSQFKIFGGGLNSEQPPYFSMRVARENPKNPGQTITATAKGDGQAGPVSASAFVKINCP